jgi:hypothetical protein
MQNLNVYLNELGWRIAGSGMEAAGAELAATAELAQKRRVATTAAKVLVDRSQPDVARMRAFSVVAAALLYCTPAPLVDTPAA